MNPFNVNMLGMANLSGGHIARGAAARSAYAIAGAEVGSTSLTSGLVQSRCRPAQRPGSIGGHSLGEGATTNRRERRYKGD